MNEQSTSTAKSEMSYGYGRKIDAPYPQAVELAREALKKEGFGVLFELDMKDKLKEKLGVDFHNYVILGACNPPVAYQALQTEPDIGLLLPCNVIVYETDGGSKVVAIDAAKMLAMVGNPALQPAAKEINEKLRRVIDSL